MASVYARALLEYALMYLERNQEGDREKARNLLNQALKIYRLIGAKKDIEEIMSKLVCIEADLQVAKPEPLQVAKPEPLQVAKPEPLQVAKPEPLQVAKPEPITEVVPLERITTGYGKLDDLLIGGIPRNYAVILTSPSCDERNLLIKRFLEAGAKNDEVTFCVTIDPSEVKSLTDKSNFYLFICNPQADRIIKDMPNVFKLKGVENLTDINIALTSAFRKLDKSLKSSTRRICIEVMSDILLQHHAVQTRRWLTGLLTDLNSRGFTTLAVIDPEIHQRHEVRAIVGIFKGEINIYEKESEKGLERFLKIKKMVNVEYLKKVLLLQE